jgi:hypothetical protein
VADKPNEQGVNLLWLWPALRYKDIIANQAAFSSHASILFT